MTITFTIPGPPVAQGRPRAVAFNGHARVYQPKKSTSYQGKVAAIAADAFARAGVAALTGALAVSIVAIFARPKTSYRKRDPRHREPRAGRPDVDNVIKSILDGMSGVAFIDDAQVARLTIAKWTGAQDEPPSVTVTVVPMGAATGADVIDRSWSEGWAEEVPR